MRISDWSSDGCSSDLHFVVAQRTGHPRGRGPLSLDEFCALDHVLISAEGGGFSGLVDDTLAMMDRRRRVTVSVQTYALAPLVVANSDCLCTLPRRFLAKYAAAIETMRSDERRVGKEWGRPGRYQLAPYH